MSWAPSHLADRKGMPEVYKNERFLQAEESRNKAVYQAKKEGWLWQDHPNLGLPRWSSSGEEDHWPMPEMEEMQVQPLEDIWIP